MHAVYVQMLTVRAFICRCNGQQFCGRPKKALLLLITVYDGVGGLGVGLQLKLCFRFCKGTTVAGWCSHGIQY